MFAVLVVGWHSGLDVGPATIHLTSRPSFHAFHSATAHLAPWNVVGVGVEQLRRHARVAAADLFPYRVNADSGVGSVLHAWCARVDALMAAAQAKADAGSVITPVCLWWNHSDVGDIVLAAMKTARPAVLHGVYNFDPTRGAFKLPHGHATRFAFACVTEDVPQEERVYACAAVRPVYPPVDLQRFADWSHVVGAREFAVTFALTNFYDGVDTGSVPRRAAVKALCAAFAHRFALFGPPNICDSARFSANGELPYRFIPWQAALSRVCLCLLADTRVRRYMNERLVLLLACGANILVDRGAGLDDDDFLGPCGHVVTYLRSQRPADLVAQVREMLVEDEAVVGARRARARALAERWFHSTAWADGIVNAAHEATLQP